jgi:hypothetical protein
MVGPTEFVVENGRVEKLDNGNFNAESMEVEVEFECEERGWSDEDTAAEVARALDSSDVE